jgi:hypothetical protein
MVAAGLVIGLLRIGEGSQGGVPVGFEGAGQEAI